MSSVRENDVLAIFCADLHFSHKPPIARSAEKDWYIAMARQLHQLENLQEEYGNCPIIVAGDIFDKWNSPPELINELIKSLPVIYAIPGQHDLPNHSHIDIRKSAYWTLVEAGKIVHLKSGKPTEINRGKMPIRLHVFPYGSELKPLKDDSNPLFVEVLLTHRYLWSSTIKNSGHMQAEESHDVHGRIRKILMSYHMCVFGDNHVPFDDKSGCSLIQNCGGFYRRRIDERKHKPSVILLKWLKGIGPVSERHYLDCSQDKFIDAEPEGMKLHIDMEDFLNELNTLSDIPINFRDAINQFLEQNKGIAKSIGNIILKALEGK